MAIRLQIISINKRSGKMERIMVTSETKMKLKELKKITGLKFCDLAAKIVGDALTSEIALNTNNNLSTVKTCTRRMAIDGKILKSNTGYHVQSLPL